MNGEWITVEKTTSGSDYLITVTFNGNTWQKNYGTTEPTPCSLSGESIPHISGSCTPSCTITAASTTGCPSCGGKACPQCSDDITPQELQVVIYGMGNGTQCGPSQGWESCSVFDGTFILGATVECAWGIGVDAGNVVCQYGSIYYRVMAISASFSSLVPLPGPPPVPQYQIQVGLSLGGVGGIGMYKSAIYTEPQECSLISGLVLPLAYSIGPLFCQPPLSITITMLP